MIMSSIRYLVKPKPFKILKLKFVLLLYNMFALAKVGFTDDFVV